MASLLTIKLNKSPGTSWGIRLQGGKDFASPLCIQKVNSGSVAEKSGLQASDAVVSINGHDVFSLRHKEAQDLIVKAGNNFDMVVQRGMQTWRPAVTPLQEVQRNPEGVPVATKTSLAATPQKPIRCIGSNYNCVPRPFPGSASLKTTNLSVPTASANGRPTSPDSRGDVRSTVSSPAFSNGYHSPSSIPTNDSSTSDIAAVPKQIVNAQFNTPINIYSEDAIAETLSAQAEILSKGVVGINFKKYDKEEKIRTDSPTYRLLHGEEDEPSPRKSRPNPVQSDSGSHLPFQHDPTEHQPAHHQPGSKAPQPTQSYPHAGHVPHAAAPGTEGLQPGENICAGCERLITGVFVRVKNKNLHADCFKCATCGSSLKNVGYYNINEKLYCDIHAKQAVRQHPPAPGMVPVTVQPGSAPPAGAMTSPQARAVKAPFQSKIPSAGFQSPAPVSAPAPPVQPEPVLQEPFVPAPAPVPEPTFPEPILEPLPVSVEEVEEPPAPPLDESEPPQEVEVLPTHEEDISVEQPQSQEVVKDSVSEEPEVDSKPPEQFDAPELVENHVQPEDQETSNYANDYANLPQDGSPLQLPVETVADHHSAVLAETETGVDSHSVPEEKAIIDEPISINGILDDVTPDIIPECEMEKSSALETAPVLPFEVKPVGKGVSFETEQVLSSSYSKHVSKEEHYVETKSSVILASDPSEILRVPVAPAPFSAPAPSPIHKVAPPAHAPVVAPSFHSSANPQNFGAPAGDLNVRAHIPKKERMGVKWSMLDTQPDDEVTQSQSHTFQPQLPHTKPKSKHLKPFSKLVCIDPVKPKSNPTTPTSAKSLEDGDSSRFPNLLPCFILKLQTPPVQESLFVNLNVDNIPPEQLSILDQIKISIERASYTMTHNVQNTEEQTNQTIVGTQYQISRSERAIISPIQTKPISEPMPTVNFDSASPSNAKELFQNALKKAAPPPLEKVTIPPMFTPVVPPKPKHTFGFKSVAPPTPSKVSVLAQ